MVNTKIRLIIFFAAKDGEALYGQQKQDQELTVAQRQEPQGSSPFLTLIAGSLQSWFKSEFGSKEFMI